MTNIAKATFAEEIMQRVSDALLDIPDLKGEMFDTAINALMEGVDRDLPNEYYHLGDDKFAEEILSEMTDNAEKIHEMAWNIESQKRNFLRSNVWSLLSKYQAMALYKKTYSARIKGENCLPYILSIAEKGVYISVTRGKTFLEKTNALF